MHFTFAQAIALMRAGGGGSPLRKDGDSAAQIFFKNSFVNVTKRVLATLVPQPNKIKHGSASEGNPIMDEKQKTQEHSMPHLKL